MGKIYIYTYVYIYIILVKVKTQYNPYEYRLQHVILTNVHMFWCSMILLTTLN